MKSPKSPFEEYTFTFQMQSPGRGLELVATVEQAGSTRTERVCVQTRDSSRVYGRYFKLGSSPFYMKPDFIYQALLANDFVLLRLMAEQPVTGEMGNAGDCSESRLASGLKLN